MVVSVKEVKKSTVATDFTEKEVVVMQLTNTDRLRISNEEIRKIRA